jgi:hypothetical protein
MTEAQTTAPKTEAMVAQTGVTAVRASGFPAAPRDANGRFLPGSPGRQPGQRNRISGRITRELLTNFEANQDELTARMQRWFLPQYMQLIGKLLLKGGAEGADELDAAELAALKPALAAPDGG